jgi:hypothetical protein
MAVAMPPANVAVTAMVGPTASGEAVDSLLSGVPVFEARRAPEFSRSRTLPVLKEEIAKSSDAHEFTRLPGKLLEGMDARGGLKLREALLAYDIGTAIVMGQESNQCVAATIFGQLFSRWTSQGQEPSLRNHLKWRFRKSV